MRLANHHKAYVGVLGVALAALAVDSFLLKDDSIGPARAQAATPAPSTPAPAPAAAGPSLAARPGPAKGLEAAPVRPRLAARLAALKEPLAPPARLALFADGPQWLNPPAPEPEAPAAGVAGDEQPAPTPVSLLEGKELTSVLVAGDRSCVILDGETLRIGGRNRKGDLMLHSVEYGAATFEVEGQLVRMVVKDMKELPK